MGNVDGTPEGSMKEIFKLFNFDDNTMSALNYYLIDGCRGSYTHLTTVEDLLVEIKEGSAAAKDLEILVRENQADFESYCGGGTGSLDPLLTTLGLALVAFDDMIVIGDQATDILTCEDINSIWVDIVHDAICTSAPSAFTWMFASITAVYASGIFIYLMRGALLPAADLNDGYKEDSDYTDDDYY